MQPQRNTLIKLSKILALTNTNHDGEKIAAICKANDILKKLGKSWEELLIVETPSPKHPQNHELSDIFNYLLECQLNNSTYDFIISLQASYRKYGKLTEKQYAALIRNYQRMGGKL